MQQQSNISENVTLMQQSNSHNSQNSRKLQRSCNNQQKSEKWTFQTFISKNTFISKYAENTEKQKLKFVAAQFAHWRLKDRRFDSDDAQLPKGKTTWSLTTKTLPVLS